MKTSEYVNFSGWLESEIRRQGLIPAQLAKRMGVANALVSNILNDRRMPKTNTLNKIADALDLPRTIVYQAAGLDIYKDSESETVSRL